MMTLEEARKRVEDARAYLHIDDHIQELAALDKQIASPDFWINSETAQHVSKQASDLRDLIDRYHAACQLLEDIQTAQELAEEDPEFAQELEQDLASLETTLDNFEVESWFSGRYDSADAIVSIHPGSGGLEAQDWTEMLYRMYTRYADRKDWKVRVLDLTPGEGIGLDHVSFQVEGRNAYGMLRSEAGVHRLVRISPTDEKKRRHTTFAAVEVVPVLPEDDITILMMFAWMYIAQVVLVAKALTPPTLRYVLLIFPLVLWLPAKTKNLSYKTRKQHSAFCVASCMSWKSRSAKQNYLNLKAKRWIILLAAKFVTTFCIRID